MAGARSPRAATGATGATATATLETLLAQARSCRHCAGLLAHAPRPVLQAGRGARILVAGQAPGRKVHASGIPFDDASGVRLRVWMGIEPAVFYDPERIAILPLGFCYPGRGRSGDLPPRPECAPLWRAPLIAALPAIELTLAIGRSALDWHWPAARRRTLTESVRAWREAGPALLPLPHPSPRNNLWLARNPWFEAELLPVLRERVRTALGGAGSAGSG
ncbi:MAG: uracil-DNA glycosylase family protein [Burkholderiales bacterium]|nr:uracil-DNA glycosylase family protein [Burkholderiales bacterium]